MVEDLDDLGLLHAGRALGLLGVVDEHDPPAGRRDQVRACDDANRPALWVDHDGGAIVAFLDLLGDVGDQELGGGGQRIALHQRTARRGQRDHPARDVAVERRGDHGGSPIAGQLEDLVGGLCVVGEHEQAGAALDGQPLCVGAIADHDHVARGGAAAGRVHRVHPHAARQRLVLAGQEPPAQDLDDRRDAGRGVLQGRGLAGLPDVAAGECPLGEDADQSAVLVDHRDDLEPDARHLEPGLADRRLQARDREARLHHVAGANHHVGQEPRLRGAAALEQPLRLGVALPEAHRDVRVARVQAVLQLRVPDRRGDRVGVRIAVAGDVDGRHFARLSPLGGVAR